MKWFKKIWTKVVYHSYDKITESMLPLNRVMLTLSLIDPKKISTIKIYKITEEVPAFAPTADQFNSLLKQLNRVIEQNEIADNIFSQFNFNEYPAYKFFQSEDQTLISMEHTTQESIEQITKVLQYYQNTPKNYDLPIVQSRYVRNKTSIDYNLNIIALYVDYLLEIQKKYST